MDCLADTGTNIFILIAIAISLLAISVSGVYMSSKRRRGFRYIAGVFLIIMIGVLGMVPSQSARAASDNSQCSPSNMISSSATNSGDVSSGSNNNDTTTSVQKIWNVPFTSDSDWSNFTQYTVSEQVAGFEPYTLTAGGGTGVITGNRTDGGSGSHRDFFIYEPAGSSKDAEVRALIEIDGSQGGLVLRASNLGDHDHQAGVVAWTNVIFGGIGTTISGIWRGFEVPGGVHQNVAPNNSGVIKLPIASIVADGATATVTTTIPIDTNPANTVVQIADVDPAIDGTAFIAVQDLYTFEFTTTASGTWSNVGVANLALNNKRWIAARVIGNQLDVKHWLPGNPEPSWNDPYNSIHYTIPPTLDNGDISPTEGKFGVIAAHIGDAKTFKYSNLQFKSLDP